MPRADAAREELLTAIQAVMEEERDRSQTKLVLCGSHVVQMQALMSERTALRGRMTTLTVHPMSYSEAAAFIADADPRARIERYAVTGGMARYLAELGSGGSLRDLICERVLDHHGALFNDPREVLEHELEQVATYFAVMQELARGERALGEIAAALRVRSTSLSRPIDTLRAMRLVERRSPINAKATDRVNRYRICDPFLRSARSTSRSSPLWTTTRSLPSDRVVYAWQPARRSSCSAAPASPRGSGTPHSETPL
jgi:AAA+ ATPase superfamily predicted ATPase